MLATNDLLQNRYRILEMIGQGGMGAVYKALDERLGNIVALKQTFFNDDEMARAFEREARLLASLDHPALPRVTDHFVENDGQFLIMEFIPGDDLGRQLKQRGQPFDHKLVLQWAYQILDVLEYLHQNRPPIIHRDIKPQNLKLNSRERIVLLDFGLAKGAPQLADLDASSIFGYTLNYAPLEQIQHSGSEQRSDLFSLGATLYHLITGTPPLGSLTRAVAIVNGEPDPLTSPSELNFSVPPAVAQVIMHAMSLRREDRPVGARAMREAFDVAINPGSTAESPASSFSAGYESVQSSNSTVYPGGPIVDDPEYGQTWFAGTPEVLSVRKPHARVQTGEHDRPNRVPVVARSLAITVSVIVAILMVIIMTNWRPDGEPVRPPIPIATRRDEARPPLDTSPPDTIRKPVTAKPDPNIPSFEMPDGVPVATGSRVTVNWSPVQGVEEYVVETANSELSGSQVIGRTKTTVYTVQPSIRTAYLRVTSVTADGRSVSSRWWPLYSARPDLVVSEKRMEGEVFTLRWWPTLGVVKYEVELRDATETRTWSAAQTVENSYNMEFPRAASSLRIVAIDSKGHRNEGIWIPVSSIQTSSFDTKQRDRR